MSNDQIEDRSKDAPDRSILTTHVGSLPRPEQLLDLLNADDRGEDVDQQLLADTVRDAVRDQVRQQAEVGIDVVSDGEMSKIGYATYLRHRISGFEIGDAPRATPADLDKYPEYRDRLHASGDTVAYLRPICRAELAYVDRGPLQTDLENLTAALGEVQVTGGFMNAPSPGSSRCSSPTSSIPTRTPTSPRSPRP
ncbi:hypothetical protein ACFQV8_16705 [Pseudonocardia benzenivorans]